MATAKPNQPAGKYYVTSDCLNCGLCEQLAPATFLGGLVIAQPTNSADEVRAANVICPNGAIRNDGDAPIIL